jgi:DNA-binding GntR family transcriptional regulator
MSQSLRQSSGCSKGAWALEQLRREILSGALPPGARLRQVEVAERLGISQIPVREAMRHLVDEGLLRILPFVGAVVAPLEPEEILEYARIRILLECDALALAYGNHTATTLALARTCWFALASARDPLTRYDAMQAFLMALYGPGNRPRLLEQILGLFRRSQRAVAIQDELLTRMDPAVPKPGAILAHLEAGHLEAAQGCLRLLYRHAAIHGAALLYEAQILAPLPVRRPRGRPRKTAP